jgi:hypothetical protein
MRSLVAAALVTMAFGGCGMGPEYTYDPPPCCPPQGVAITQPQVLVAPPPVPAQPQPVMVQPVMVQPVMAQPLPPSYANPVFVPIADPQCTWEQVVDVVDDYFRIEREEPVRVAGNTMTEGTLTTAAQVSPTILEPWHRDTADWPQRVENSLQSMRRRAVVRVVPAPGGHWIDVQVFKELEDLRRPEQATAGGATFRYDDSLTRIVNPVGDQQATQGWIAQGRDAPLEQQIICDLVGRCGTMNGRVVMRGQSAGPSPKDAGQQR